MKSVNSNDTLGRTTMTMSNPNNNKILPNNPSNTNNNKLNGPGFNSNDDSNNNSINNKGFYSQNPLMNTNKKVFYTPFNMNRILPPPPPPPPTPVSFQANSNANLMNLKPLLNLNNFNVSKKLNMNTTMNIVKYGSDDYFINNKNYNNSNTSGNNSNIIKNESNVKLLNYLSNENFNSSSMMSSLHPYSSENKNSSFNGKNGTLLRATKSCDAFHYSKTNVDNDSLEKDGFSNEDKKNIFMNHGK